MGIHINPLGEMTRTAPPYEMVDGSSLNITELREQLRREPTPSDIEREFQRRTRRALSSEKDWLLYRRYMHFADMFSEAHSLYRLVANNAPKPRVWLAREFGTQGLSLDEVRSGVRDTPWVVEPAIHQEEDWGGDNWEATLNITYMDDGEVFRLVYLMEDHIECLSQAQEG